MQEVSFFSGDSDDRPDEANNSLSRFDLTDSRPPETPGKIRSLKGMSDSFSNYKPVDSYVPRPVDLREHFPTIRAKGVDGLQLGNDTLQVNARRYELDVPSVDFKATLARSDVRLALRYYLSDPTDSSLYRSLDRTLTKKPLLGASDHRLGLEPESTEVRYRTATHARTEAFVLVEKCRGVQAADSGVQYNYRVCVATPTINEVRLLRDSPELRRELIASLCGTNGANESLRERIADSLRDACLAVPGLRDTGAKIELDSTRSVDVTGGDGVTIGKSVRQQNEVEVIVVVEGVNVETHELTELKSAVVLPQFLSGGTNHDTNDPVAHQVRRSPHPSGAATLPLDAEENSLPLTFYPLKDDLSRSSSSDLPTVTIFERMTPTESIDQRPTYEVAAVPHVPVGSAELASELGCKLPICYARCKPGGTCFLKGLPPLDAD